MNEERVALLKKYISEEPDNPFNLYALSMEYYDEAPEKARPLMEELVEKHGEYLPTYFKLAHLYWDLEEWSKADHIFLSGIGLAWKLSDQKALDELQAAYQNFQYDRD